MQRVLMWLETEASTYWSGQIRKRHENVEKCKDAVRQKKLFKSPTGSTQSAVEEEKQLRIAQKRLEEAEEKLKNVKRYTPRLQKGKFRFIRAGCRRLRHHRLGRYSGGDQPARSNDGGFGSLCQRCRCRAAERMIRGSCLRADGQGDGGGCGCRAGLSADAAEDGGCGSQGCAARAMLRLVTWADGGLPEQERELFSKIATDRKNPRPEDMVIVEQGAWESSGRFYLERVNFGGWRFGLVCGEAGGGAFDRGIFRCRSRICCNRGRI